MTGSGFSPSAVVVVVSMFLLTGCLTGQPPVDFPDASPPGEALGRIEVESRTLGITSLAPVDCSSGDRQFFLGGDFAEASRTTVVRLAVDPIEGPAVRVFDAGAPFENDVVFRREECSVFQFTMESTGWRVNEVYDYRITLEVDCERAGESIRGRVATDHCH